MPTISATYPDEKSLAPYYCKYPQATNPQPVYVELDCRDGSLCLDYSADSGVPMGVYHGHVRQFGTRSEISAAACRRLLDAVTADAQIVVDGYTSERDGSNHVARFTDAALEALDRIERACDDVSDDDCDQVWDAGDWLEQSTSREDGDDGSTYYEIDLGTERLVIRHDTADAQIDEYAARVISTGLDERVLVLGAERHLLNLRDQCEAPNDTDDTEAR